MRSIPRVELKRSSGMQSSDRFLPAAIPLPDYIKPMPASPKSASATHPSSSPAKVILTGPRRLMACRRRAFCDEDRLGTALRLLELLASKPRLRRQTSRQQLAVLLWAQCRGMAIFRLGTNQLDCRGYGETALMDIGSRT